MINLNYYVSRSCNLIASKTLKNNMKNAMKKKQRLSYSIMFKLAAVCYAEIYGNRATARYIGVNEKQIRDWRSKKHHLVHCDSKAKRLKGAAKHRDENKIAGKGENGCGIAKERHCSIGYPSFIIEDCEENKMKFLSCFLDISTSKRQMYDETYQYQRTNHPEVNSKEKMKEMEKGIDFHERFSCALALLDLKKGT